MTGVGGWRNVMFPPSMAKGMLPASCLTCFKLKPMTFLFSSLPLSPVPSAHNYLVVCHYSLAESCSTLCNPMDCTGSSVQRISQARILEWVANFLLQGIFPTQGLILCLLHWRAGSLPLSHQGSPIITYLL